MSDFSGLHIALSSLYAQRRGLELTGHNVANANTEGYSRQRVDLVNVGAPARPALWAKWVGDGQGVRVADVTRFRDVFLELQAALEHGSEASLSRTRTALGLVEQVFAEPSDTGIAAQLTEFWSGWDDVANHPADPAIRTQLLERAATVASTFNQARTALSAMTENATQELAAVVNELNTTAASIARLNEAIKSAVHTGLSANDLMDQRDLLANKLAGLAGASLRPGEFGAVNVYLGGTALVFEAKAEALELDSSVTPVVVRWTKDDFPATITTGDLGGLLEVVNTTFPAHGTALDAIATQLRDDVNALHAGITGSIDAAARDQSAAGNLDFEIGLDGGAFATVSVAGADWSGAGGAAALQAALQAAVDGAVGGGNATVTVTGGAGEPLALGIAPTGTNELQVRASGSNAGFATLLGTTGVGLDGIGGRAFFSGSDAATLALTDHVVGTPDAVAAGLAGAGPLDGSRALDLAELASSSTGPSALYRTMIMTLGVESQTAQRRHEIQQATMQQVDDSRAAYSGVDLDEEMVNMVQFQHAYDAAARFMSAIDEMLDTLINRTAR